MVAEYWSRALHKTTTEGINRCGMILLKRWYKSLDFYNVPWIAKLDDERAKKTVKRQDMTDMAWACLQNIYPSKLPAKNMLLLKVARIYSPTVYIYARPRCGDAVYRDPIT